MKKLMITAIVLATNLAIAAQNVSREVQLPTPVSQVKMVDAQYDLVPTEVITRPIPGCVPYGDTGQDCNETIVVASEEVIRVNISYQDDLFYDDSHSPRWTSVVFRTSDFTTEQVELLKSVYPQWKHGFSRIPQKFARENFTFDVKEVKQTIQIPDPSKSKFCVPHGDTDYVDPNCKEEIVYKESWRKVMIATVTKK